MYAASIREQVHFWPQGVILSKQPFNDLTSLHRTDRSMRARSTGRFPFFPTIGCSYDAYEFRRSWADTGPSLVACEGRCVLFQCLVDRCDVARGVVAEILCRAAPPSLFAVIEPTAEQRLGGLVISVSAA